MSIILLIAAALFILYAWGTVAYYYGFYKRNPL